MAWIGQYILEGKIPKKCEDIYEWSRWMEGAKRHVAQEIINGKRISTVFLGLDHSFGRGPPLLFETMIFANGDPNWQEEYMDRYSTWEEAEKGHRRAVNHVTGRIRAVES